MLLSEALQDVEVVRHLGSDPHVSGVEYDSRRVAPESVFVAMRGETTDGNEYIEGAVARGAAAVVTDSAAAFDKASAGPLKVPVVEVAHGRRALAAIAANVFGHPERQLAISGVTGTNGKTTTSFLLEQILKQHGRRTVLVGTIEYHVGDEIRPAPHTTPESRDLLALFAEGVRGGATEAVMEVSSHGLEQGRVWGVPFDVAIFTNLTRDHLDFHGSMEAYGRAKQRLFEGYGTSPPRIAVINADDPFGLKMAEVAAGHGSMVWSYGIDAGEFRAEAIEIGMRGMRFRIQTPMGSANIATELVGRVNVYNLLAASAAAMARGITLQEIAVGTPALKPVPGRFEAVNAGQPFAVVVDYAHTDDALRNVLLLAREMVGERGGRVITVFGCGGDRDRTKRPIMGRVAGQVSEIVIVTSDNPRSEEPMRVIEDILPGLRETNARCRVEPDRAQAIELAIEEARAGDVVLLAGKGHEKTQTIAGKAYPFDDVAVARRAILSKERAKARY